MEDLVLSCLESRVEDNRTLYSRFLIGPFFKGDALTVATALRRVLLSSVESVAITALYIQGITHEFSTIVGVRESVLELSLNFQSIVLSYDKNFFQKKNLFEDFQIGYLQVQGPKVVYANDLKLPLGIKVVYPAQYIATVSREGVIVLKFTIGKMDNRLASSVSSHASETDSRKQIIHHPVFGELVKKNIARTKKRYSYKSIYAINTLANAPRVQSGALYEPRSLHFGVRTKARTKLRFVRRCKQSGALQRTWLYKPKVCTCKQSSALQKTWRGLYWLYKAELCTRTNRRFVCKERAFVRISKKKTNQNGLANFKSRFIREFGFYLAFSEYFFTTKSTVYASSLQKRKSKSIFKVRFLSKKTNFNFSTIKRATPFFALHTKRLLIRFGENRCGDDPTNSLSEVDKNFYKPNTNPAFTESRSLQSVGLQRLSHRLTKRSFVRAKGKRSWHKCAFVNRFSMRRGNFGKAGAGLVDYVTRTANQKALALAFIRAAKVNFTRQAHRVNIKNASIDRSHTKATEASTKTFIPICSKGAFPFVPLIQSKSSVLTKAQQVKTSYKSKFWKIKSSKALIYRSFSLPANTSFLSANSCSATLSGKQTRLTKRSFVRISMYKPLLPLRHIPTLVSSQTGTVCVGEVYKVPTLLPVAPPYKAPLCTQRNAPKVQRNGLQSGALYVRTNRRFVCKERAFVRALFLNQRSIAYKAPLCKRCINKSKQIQSPYKTKTDTSIFNVLCKKYISKHRLQEQEEFFKYKKMHRWTTIDRCFYKSKPPLKTSICTHHLSLNRVVGMQKQLLFAKRLNNLSFFKVKYSSLVKRGVKRVDKVFKSDICLRNIIPLDFTLPPVLRVNFVIEIDDEVLYLRQKVRERIILEVWTNGSIHPRQAVHDATLSLLDMFSSFRSLYQVKSYSPPQLKLPGYSKNLKPLYHHLR